MGSVVSSSRGFRANRASGGVTRVDTRLVVPATGADRMIPVKIDVLFYTMDHREGK